MIAREGGAVCGALLNGATCPLAEQLDEEEFHTGRRGMDSVVFFGSAATGVFGGVRVLAGAATVRAGVAAGSEVAQLAGPLRNALRAKAGFRGTGEPIIVDPSIGANPQTVAAALRGRGVNARSVREAFGRTDIPDADILRVADQLEGRVLAADRGRDIGGGFGQRAVRVPNRARSVDTVVRIFMSRR